MENAIKLTDDYYLSSDGKLNLILHERYEKRSGKGKNAPLSGEFAFNNAGYFRRLNHVGDHLVDKEVYKYVGSELEGAVLRIEKLRDEIKQMLNESIKLDWDKKDIEEVVEGE